MEEVKQGKKFGSRRLSQEEVEQILPTYSHMLSQIEDMRQSYTQDRKDPSAQEKRPEQLEFVQRINNISVLGKRGCGKTSILKTLRQDLEAQNSSDNKKVKNIILPLIVPENMGESMNLMSTILGLFKPLVAQFAEKDKQNSLYCPTNDEQKLQETYNNLVRSFCYIQPNYHDVVLKDYVSGTKYVQNAAAIFEADVRFEEQFNAFLGALFAQKSYHEDTMLFVFVDDIDLSTHRCTDVVKTLLAYLSHPRIITFISGDLEIFEEALTLEFLRQEKALDTTLLDVTFLKAGSEKSLLKSKQTLSYEYLKKVLPPLYRHHVNAWSIHQRGYFKISQPGDGPALTLATLLTNTFQNYGCATYFQYYDMTEVNTDGKHPLKPIPELFHLFDETARGLNNVYNALLDADKVLNCADKGPKQEKEAFISIKAFLETVVNANPKLKDDHIFLLQTLIEFGSNFASTTVRVDQFVHAIKTIYIKDKAKGSALNSQLVVRWFTRFLFMDLTLLLMQKDRHSEIYELAKQNCVTLLLDYSSISLISENESLISFESGSNLVLSSIFKNEDFSLCLRWYQYLIREIEKMPTTFQSKYAFLWNALLNIEQANPNEVSQESLSHLKKLISLRWQKTQKDYEIMRSRLSPVIRTNLLKRIFAETSGLKELSFAKKSCFNYSKLNIAKKSFELGVSLIINWLDSQACATLLVDNQLKTILNFEIDYPIGKLNLSEKNRFLVIQQISERNLWDTPIGERIKDFVASHLSAEWEKLHYSNDVHWSIRWNNTFLEAYNTFKLCEKGGNNTVARRTFHALNRLIETDPHRASNEIYKLEDTSISLEHFIEVYSTVYPLSVNNRPWYGREECAKICRTMEEMPAHCEANNWEEKKGIILLYLYYYALIQLIDVNHKELYLQNETLAKLAQLIDEMPGYVQAEGKKQMQLSLDAMSHFLPDLDTLEELFPEGT